MENYICINGKKAELTEEQMKKLGIELPKANPFARVHSPEMFYHISITGDVLCEVDIDHFVDRKRFDTANYCTDEAIMQQRALHEILNRLLWRYSMEHDGDKINWIVASKNKYFIYYNYQDNEFLVNYANTYRDIGQIYFYTWEIAKAAIKEIIEPFMKAHPEFKW